MKRFQLIAVAAVLALAALNDQAFAQSTPVLIGSQAGAPTATCATTAAPAGTWGINAAGLVTFNGVAQANTSGVVLGACINGTFSQMNGGNAWWLAGGTATAVTWSGGSTTPPAGVSVPAAPVTLAKGGNATLNWTAPTTDTMGNPIPTVSGAQTNAATGINVYQGTNANALTKIASVGPAVLTYTATGLTGGTYFFAVTYVNALGEGTKSNIVSGTMPAAPVVVLGVSSAPKSLSAK